MKLETDYIEKLAKIISDNSLTEISLEEGEFAITIRKEQPNIINAPIPVNTAYTQDTPKTVEPEHKGNAVVSLMVGTFYSKPAPDAEPFVKVGDIVSAGDVVCIVEAMKLMNEIETEFSGKVTEICLTDGQVVEYGQPIMYIE